jgi:hypothetical protein
MLGSHQGGNVNKEIHISRGTIGIIITLLLAILGFNWDTRERVIKVEEQLKNHMIYTEPKVMHTSLLSNILSSIVQADTIKENNHGIRIFSTK